MPRAISTDQNTKAGIVRPASLFSWKAKAIITYARIANALLRGSAKKIIFLTCDAYGVLPPIAKLSKGQAMYHYLSGYTAKVAGTELGVTEPKATFSACFGKAFLLVHPIKYAEILGKKMDEHGSTAYLMNTGWIEGKYGIGRRIPLKDNRLSIDAIFDGSLDQAEFETMPIFGLQIPKKVNGVESSILDPRNAWKDKADYDKTIKNLAELFIKNFQHYATFENCKSLVQYGPQL